MKLEKVLSNLNSFEKNSFLKIIDGILSNNPINEELISTILSNDNRDLKNVDNINVAKVFSLIESEFTESIADGMNNASSQFDILIDIISKDGNSIMKQDWFARRYDEKLQKVKAGIKEFNSRLVGRNKNADSERLRDYSIYLECLRTAYKNDEANNQELKITTDEQSILSTLSRKLGLSQEEIKLIKYQVIPLDVLDIDSIINELKNLGVIFFSKKNNTVYVADEVVRLLRIARGKEIADKFYRRVLMNLREPQINQICKKYQIEWRDSVEKKIAAIIDNGIPFSSVLVNDMHRPGTTLTAKKKEINILCDKQLNITPPIKGVLIEDKVANLIKYFEEVEMDDRLGISIDGYDKMLRELQEYIPITLERIREVFEIQEVDVLRSGFLLDFNIKPRDVLELLVENELKAFCDAREISTRGNIIDNIMDAYRNAEDLYIENYEHIGLRDLNMLKSNGVILREAELGIKFEQITKKLFSSLGFNVDEKLRRELNTTKDKIDIVLNLGELGLILVECKTVKEKGYNKFSSVSRQMRSYVTLTKNKGYRVVKSLLVAPEFSDEFIKDCGLEYELNLSLIEAGTLRNIVEGYEGTKLKQFPHNLLLRDVVIQEDRVLNAIER